MPLKLSRHADVTRALIVTCQRDTGGGQGARPRISARRLELYPRKDPRMPFDAPRHDWTKEEIDKLYTQPLDALVGHA